MSRQRIKLSNLDARLQSAVELFWSKRTEQGERQGVLGGGKDRGGRAAVTGGGHSDGIVRLVAEILTEHGIPEECVFTNRRSVDLPLYFRPHRDWDLVVVWNGVLVACFECKSHIGPSFGNNYNNRVQEAIGDGYDLALAYREGMYKPSPRPWAGYFMLVEDSPRSRAGVKIRERHFPVDPVFKDASYIDRYEVTITRMVRESLYDAAALVVSQNIQPPTCECPFPELSFRRLALSLVGHAVSVVSE